MPNAIQTSEGYGYIQHEGMFAGAVPLQPANTFVPVAMPETAPGKAGGVGSVSTQNPSCNLPIPFILGGVVIFALVVLKNSNT